MAEDEQLKMRFAELAERSEKSGAYTETKFLNTAEQSVLQTLRLPVPFAFFGGFDGAERRIAVFGSEESAGYKYEPPIVCIRIAPANARFADELTHRDFLGSLMALGVTREMLGDIIVADNCGYLFCLETISEYVISSLTEVKHTTVRPSLCDAPPASANEGEERSLTVASERLDALVAAVYRLPREDAKALCEKGLVFVNSRLALKGGAEIPENAIVSVRGRGRFRYMGLDRTTKKGRLRVLVRVW